MTKTHEKLLIATLAGIIIAGAAAFAIQPALASNVAPKASIQLVTTTYDVLDLRLTRL